MNNFDYDSTIRKLYEGILSKDGWQDALADMRSLLNCEQATFLVHDHAFDATRVSESARFDLAFVQDYESYFEKIDPVRPVVAGMKLGEWFLDEQHLGRQIIRQDDFYQVFLRQHGLGSVMCCALANVGRHMAGLAFQAGLSRESMSGDDIARISPLMPHLLQASRLRMECKRLSEFAQLGQRLLDSFPSPVLIVNARGEVLFANRAGDIWLHGTGQVFGHRGAAKQERPCEAVATLARRLCGNAVAPTAGVRLVQDGGKVCYLLGLSLHDEHPIAGLFNERVGLIVVRGTGESNEEGMALFRQLFGLTGAELRLVAVLQRHENLRGAAATLGVTHDTARSQLKTIFLKTGSHSQGALLGLWAELVTDCFTF